jgi:hypothetical protein
MKPEPKRNLPASVRQRLLTLSQRRKEPFDLVLVRYGIERLLYRLSRSPTRKNSCSKARCFLRSGRTEPIGPPAT